MFSMYCDSTKNIMMKLPDDIPEEMIFTLAADQIAETPNSLESKFTAFYDFTNSHATFEKNDIVPADLVNI